MGGSSKAPYLAEIRPRRQGPEASGGDGGTHGGVDVILGEVLVVLIVVGAESLSENERGGGEKGMGMGKGFVVERGGDGGRIAAGGG